MVNGNYVLYGDRSCSESEIVDDHVQTRTTERKVKRKPNRTANELQHSLNLAKLENDTDSVKYEKKIKEPRLLRNVPTTDIEEHYVTEKFETYDLKPSEELPRRHNYTKKPKNPTDGSFHYCNSRSSSSCSSPNGNLPTISEQCESYGTYRIRGIQAPPLSSIGFDNKLDKYFAKPKEVKSFTAKVGYNGSHPDSLYRVGTDSSLGSNKAARVMRVMRWPLALIIICVALGTFVYFLMPANLSRDTETTNITTWEESINGAQTHSTLNKFDIKPDTKIKDKKSNPGTKTPEIDFYEADNDENDEVTSIIEAMNDFNLKRKLPAPPVFPTHISPEVQYGNEKADTDKIRIPKLLNDIQNTLPGDSTSKPHITQKPEKPLAIYFRDGSAITTSSTEAITAASENFANAESSNGLSGYVERENENDHEAIDNTKEQTLIYEEQSTNKEKVAPEDLDYYNTPVNGNNDAQFTSGHSKIFGVSIEHAANMKSTTQHSLYNTRVSPTLPTWRDKDDTTTKNYPVNNPDVPQCRSTRLALCRGILPYDLAGASAVIGNTDVAMLLPQIEYLVNTNCSDRLKHFACALLEPECSPQPFLTKLPCYNFCKAIIDSCEGYIPAELSRVFNCNQYSSYNCVTARAPCFLREMQCGDGSCIPRDWVCDGTKDCVGGEDEAPCSTCERNEYRCSSGMCISKNWLCDGYADCPSGEDETDNLCSGKTRRKDQTVAELGEEIAGSAPEPSVRRPNRLSHSSSDRNDGLHPTGDNDNSKELLMTSDTNNGYRRNFTRRPSPSRLMPYKRQRMSTYTEPEPTTTIPTSLAPEPPKMIKKPNKQRSRTEAPKDMKSEEDLGEFDFFSESNKNEKQASPVEKASTLPEEMNRAPSPSPERTMIDKLSNKLERHIDGASMLKKAQKDLDTTDTPDSLEANATATENEWGVGETYNSAHASPCPAGELRCVEGRCITLAQLCDGTIDCSDHADEDNCYT